jgi:hypothetical protein
MQELSAAYHPLKEVEVLAAVSYQAKFLFITTVPFFLCVFVPLWYDGLFCYRLL